MIPPSTLLIFSSLALAAYAALLPPIIEEIETIVHAPTTPTDDQAGFLPFPERRTADLEATDSLDQRDGLVAAIANAAESQLGQALGEIVDRGDNLAKD